ncbi:hypothetical protein AAFF_G00089090 [Aldrovandia affinis]|uniref:FAM21/CAPZIP domain-containing protein n=1 Tax=Aldrovandia affinis TaxID=143900 RepID=A0AAD7RW92_9TELE|nr:hypothetical protein AAFF_G00089090 [Aldrovandia affinis]
MEKKPVRRRPPRSLQLKKPEEHSDEEKHAGASPHAPKAKPRNSPLIEKLQANLALTPTALLPPSKSPEVRLQPTSSSPSPTLGPPSPALCPPSPALGLPSPGLSPALLSEEEAPVSFEDPPEGSVLPSFNKDRARLSFRRRPPSRQHRKSCGEEGGAAGGRSSPCQLDSQRRNEGEEEAPEKTSRKMKRVRVRKTSGRNTDKRDSAERGDAAGTGTPDETQPGAAGNSEEREATAEEVKSPGNEASESEGEGLQVEPRPDDNIRANRKAGEETQPQEGKGISPDEDEPESTGD